MINVLIRLVFHERIGCFSVGNTRISINQHPPPEFVMACRSAAQSLGLRVFAVRNSIECLGDNRLPSMLSHLSASEGCLGGRGGQNVSDVYRLTSKRAFALCISEKLLRLSFYL